MHPIAFDLFGRPIHWYGILVASGFLLAMLQWSWLARREGRRPGLGSDLGFWIMVGGIGGARLAYVVANWPMFAADPLSIVRIDQGGLIFYGGLLGCVLVVILMARREKTPLLAMADFTILPVPLGHAIGRVGCFLNGCCFGTPTSCPVGVRYPADSVPATSYPGLALHPVQLYETVWNLALYGLLIWCYRRKRRDGMVLAVYGLVYPLGRFLDERFRGDGRVQALGLSVAQLISLAIFLLGAGLLLVLLRRSDRAQAS